MTGGGGRGDRGATSWAWVLLAVPVGLVGVLALLSLLAFGLRPGGGDGGGGDDEAAPGVGELDPGAAEDERVGVVGASAAADAVVRVDAGGGRLSPPARITSPVRAGVVIEVQGSSFLEHATGVVAQCDGLWGRSCRNVFPITTDGDGRVRALYRLEPTDGAGTLVVEVDRDRAGAVLDGRAAPGAVAGPGGDVRVVGLAAGASVAAVLCDEHADGLADCRGRVAAVADRRGLAAIDLPDVRRGERVVLVDESGTALTEPVAVTAPPSSTSGDGDVRVDLDPRRVAVGLTLALLLAVAAAMLVRTTDWRVPPEAEVEP